MQNFPQNSETFFFWHDFVTFQDRKESRGRTVLAEELVSSQAEATAIFYGILLQDRALDGAVAH